MANTPFDSPEAERINKARMDHLESLGLDLAHKAVLDVGCGVGKLATFFMEKGCFVYAMDARSENIDEFEKRHRAQPRWRTLVEKVEDRWAIWQSTNMASRNTVDIVFCYGLLYHLTDPAQAIQNMAATGAKLLLLETMVCDCSFSVLLFEPEEKESLDQGLSGWGTRPSTSLIVKLVSAAGWPHVYLPCYAPLHPDFQWTSANSGIGLNGRNNLRRVFVASLLPLANSNLLKI